jgi:tetratricopeptide (TPR) repeat protein
LEYFGKKVSGSVGLGSAFEQSGFLVPSHDNYARGLAETYLKSAFEERLLGHTKKAEDFCDNAQAVIKRITIDQPNITLKLGIERACNQLCEGNIKTAWRAVVSALTTVKKNEKIDPYLISYLYATEGLCLQLFASTENALDYSRTKFPEWPHPELAPNYARGAMENSYFNRPPDLDLASPYISYAPLIHLREAQYGILTGNPDALENFYIANTLAENHFPESPLLRSYVNYKFAEAYMDEGNLSEAVNYFRDALSSGFEEYYTNSNLAFAINTGLAEALFGVGDRDEALYVLGSAVDKLSKVSEAKGDDFSRLATIILKNTSPDAESFNTLELLDDVQAAHSRLYTGSIDLDVRELAYVGGIRFRAKEFKKSYDTYNLALEKARFEPETDPKTLMHIHEGRRDTGFILNERAAVYSASCEILKEISKLPTLEGETTLLGIAYLNTALGSFLTSRYRLALKSLNEADAIFSSNFLPGKGMLLNSTKIRAAVAFELGCFKTAEKLHFQFIEKGGFGDDDIEQDLELQLNQISMAWAQLKYGNIAGCKTSLEVIPHNSPEHIHHQIQAIEGYFLIGERGDPKEVGRLIGDAVSACRQTYPAGSPQLGTAFVWLGDANLYQGKFEDAKTAYLRAENIFNDCKIISFDRCVANRRLSKAYGHLGQAESGKAPARAAGKILTILERTAKQNSLV